MKKSILLLAIALVSSAVHGQTAIATNAAPVAGTSKAPPPINLEVSPEVQLQILEGASQEIGKVPPGDLEDHLARLAKEKAKWLAIAERKAAMKAAAANRQPSPVYVAPASGTYPATSVPSSPLPGRIVYSQEPHVSSVVAELDSVIAQLTAIRGKIAVEDTNVSNSK